MDEKFIIKTYSKTELAQAYDVSLETFMKWIKPILSELNLEKSAKLLYPAQVRKIVDFLGLP